METTNLSMKTLKFDSVETDVVYKALKQREEDGGLQEVTLHTYDKDGNIKSDFVLEFK